MYVNNIYFGYKIQTNPYHPTEQLKQQGDGDRETPQLRQITSCRARVGQQARPSHKHCKPCDNDAYAPRPRARTGLHDFHLVEFSHHPVPSQ